MGTRRLRFMALVAVGLMGWAGLAPTRSSEAVAGGVPLCLNQLNTCSTSLATSTADLLTAQSDLATCNAALLAAAGKLPATGQTTCYDSSGGGIPCASTGQDGDIQAGAALSYTDNGDGTITDNTTGLMWEKKSDDGTIHDQDNTYTWANAFAVHIVGLNADSGFAGHTDWRLPNIKELQSIVNYENAGPSVSLKFNNNCISGASVLTGSCTQDSFYWSSTSVANSPAYAWARVFSAGIVFTGTKSFNSHVRAVRGGL